MIANINEKTGIAYGVLNANDVPDLYDDIVSCGDNLSYKAFEERVVKELQDAVRKVIDTYTYDADKRFGEREASDLFESLDLGDNYECGEEEYFYEYETKYGKVEIRLGYLGGAPLIWVLTSPYCAMCSVCSPCVPNAGDLNTPGNGVLAYCVPPEDMPKELVKKLKVRLVTHADIKEDVK